MNPAAILAILKSPLFRYLAVAGAVVGLLFFVYHKGEQHTQALWDADKARIEAEIEKAKATQGKITTVVETKYVDRVKVVRGKTQVIVNTVDRLVPIDRVKCDVPETAVNLLDAAARNFDITEVAK